MHVRTKRALRKLKRDFPLSLPVRVSTHETLTFSDGTTRIYGTCRLINGRVEIWLERHDDISVMNETLWHEWTHCLLWPRCRYRHTETFWQIYGRIYRHYQD